MKYKVNDRVRIQSKEWYESHKNKFGKVWTVCLSGEGTICFDQDNAKYCGKVLTIAAIEPENYAMVGNSYAWTDEMIEGLVERNGKTYPYKIGDRVVLKGNNRCATITDLKYNSWGNLSYYIKIDNDKDISVDYPTDLLLPYDNKVEDVVEEETKPEFKVGDKITNGKVTLTILTLAYDRYIVEDNLGGRGTLYFNFMDNWKLVEEETEPLTTKNMDNIIEEAKTYWDSIKDAWICPEGYQFVDENGNVINATKIVLEKKKKEYPKTYEGCCKILNLPVRDLDILDNMFVTTEIVYNKNLDRLLNSFRKLLICRDAYWKIYGDEMGLRKPWEPNWTSFEGYPAIYMYRYQITLSVAKDEHHFLVFPTAEMRDAFYENFKEEIEICKELL